MFELNCLVYETCRKYERRNVSSIVIMFIASEVIVLFQMIVSYRAKQESSR